MPLHRRATGRLPTNFVTKTAAYTAVPGDAVEGDSTSGAFVVTLPSAPFVGATVSAQKVDASGNALIVLPASGGSVNGAANLLTSTRWASALLVHKGADVWRIVASAMTLGGASTPGQVTNLAATPADSSVGLTWDAPSAGSMPITDYLVEYKATASGTWLTFADGVSTTAAATVTGLTNGTGYDFRVSAISAVGTGTASAAASATPTA